MPTGYTADVLDGSITELAPFVMQLARGMGALITMRDMPSNAPIPERFEPSQYNADRLREAKSRREELYAMDKAAAQAAADAEHSEWTDARAEYFASKAQGRARYQAMIKLVEAWEGAPEGIKEFGLEQLRYGMDFDCPASPTFYRDEPPLDGQAWVGMKLAQVARDIEYHAAEHAKECERTEGRNAWLAQLRKSLEPSA